MLRKLLLQLAPTARRFLSAQTKAATLLNRCSAFSYSSSSQSEIPQSNSIEQLEDQHINTISIDRSGLYNPPMHCHEPSSDSELVKHLKGIIKFRGGPISVAEYMEEVLTDPNAGFYINRNVFGAEGDFITSPEVSQMFGEMVFGLFLYGNKWDNK